MSILCKINRVINSSLDIKGIDFRTNIAPTQEIKKGAFGGTYWRDIYSAVNGKWYRKTWKEFDKFKSIY